MDEQSYCRRCIVGLSIWLVSITINIGKQACVSSCAEVVVDFQGLDSIWSV